MKNKKLRHVEKVATKPVSATITCSAGVSSLQFALDVLQILAQYDGQAVSVEIKAAE